MVFCECEGLIGWSVDSFVDTCWCYLLLASSWLFSFLLLLFVVDKCNHGLLDYSVLCVLSPVPDTGLMNVRVYEKGQVVCIFQT
jgi:hypothetical protein